MSIRMIKKKQKKIPSHQTCGPLSSRDEGAPSPSSAVRASRHAGGKCCVSAVMYETQRRRRCVCFERKRMYRQIAKASGPRVLEPCTDKTDGRRLIMITAGTRLKAAKLGTLVCVSVCACVHVSCLHAEVERERPADAP